jgi:hypothetical protein
MKAASDSQQTLSDITKDLCSVQRDIVLLLGGIQRENIYLREETAFLRDKVDQLSLQLAEHTAATPPPRPSPPGPSSAVMGDIQLQLSVVQSDIQHVLSAVRAPPPKRKRASSGHQQEPTMPTQRHPQHPLCCFAGTQFDALSARDLRCTSHCRCPEPVAFLPSPPHNRPRHLQVSYTCCFQNTRHNSTRFTHHPSWCGEGLDAC